MIKPYHSRKARGRFYRQEKLKRRLRRLTKFRPSQFSGRMLHTMTMFAPG